MKLTDKNVDELLDLGIAGMCDSEVYEEQVAEAADRVFQKLKEKRAKLVSCDAVPVEIA